MDEIIKNWAAHLRKVYDERTAGDYTFEGILYEFGNEMLNAYNEVVRQKMEEAIERYGN